MLIIDCFEDDVDYKDCKVLDWPTMYHVYSWNTNEALDDYAEKTFIGMTRYLLS